MTRHDSGLASTTRRTPTRTLNARYDGLLAQAGPAALADDLAAACWMRDLALKGRPLCSVLRPRFLSAGQYAELVRETEAALEILGLAETAMRTDLALRDRLLGAHPFRAVMEASLNYRSETIGRFDGLIDATGQIRFIEYNSGLCGGSFASDGLAAVFDTLPPMASLRRETGLHCRSTGPLLIDSIWQAAIETGGAARPSLALVVPDGSDGSVDTGDCELRLLLAAWRARGGDARVIRVAELGCRDERLQAGDWTIDAVLVVDWVESLRSSPRDHPIWQLEAARRSWSVNSLGAAVFRSGKQLFAAISDPASGIAFDHLQRLWIDRHIPWTRMLRAGETSYRGDTVELLAHVIANRKWMVLKPCFAMAGRGVVLGWECSAQAWRAAIEAGAGQAMIVQERVMLDREPFPAVQDDVLVRQPMYGDLCPFVWRGSTVDGLYCRLSEAPLLNASLGHGSIVPAYIFGEAPAAPQTFSGEA